MKKYFYLFTLLVLFSFNVEAIAEESPIITMKTHIYENVGPGNACSISLMAKEETVVEVDFGFGREEYVLTPEFTPGEDEEEHIGTFIAGEVSDAGVITVYGDASKIDYFNASGIYMYELEMSTLTNLEYLIISHNELTRLDLTEFTKLQFVNLADNPFKHNNLKIGENHPDLVYLNINQIPKGGMELNFNVDKFTQLQYLTAWANKDITYLDVSKCPYLQYLSLDCAEGMTSIDVSANSELQVLNVSDSGISSIDITNNPKLKELYCDHMGYDNGGSAKLSALDITKNPELVYLFCSGNNLTELDVTNNTKLTHVFASANYLTSIDVSNNEELLQLGISKNFFNFASLPEQGLKWLEYVYVNQRPMPVAPEQKVGTILDFSDKVLRDGTTTLCAMYKSPNMNPTEVEPLKEGVDYTYVDGKVKLLTEQTDSVYCEFVNSMFGTLLLRSANFMIKSEDNMGKPTKVFSFKPAVAGELSFNVTTFGEESSKILVDFGDGELKEFATHESAASGEYEISGIAGEEVVIYAPEGVVITGFMIENVELADVDLNNAYRLEVLKIKNCKLANVDLSFLKYLKEIDLSDNALTRLDLSGVNFYFDKNVSYLNVANNQLEQLDLGDFKSNLVELNASNNKLVELDLEEAIALTRLNLSNNNIVELDLLSCKLLEELNITNNNFYDLETYGRDISVIEYSGNYFSYASMIPNHPKMKQTYAPQSEIVIPNRGLSVDLSAQVSVRKIIYSFDGFEYMPEGYEMVPTTFIWKYEDGTLLEEGVDYTVENGVTKFLEENIGKVYCELVNSEYPDFVGDNILKTTLMEVASMPTNVIATFTPTQSATIQLSLAASEKDTFFYADWGDGELKEYKLDTTYALYEGTTIANVPVNFYSFDDDCKINVFSVSDIRMKRIDVTKLTNLTTLTVSGTGLSTIDISKATKLTELNLEGNNLSSVDMSNNPDLWMVILSNNKLTDIDLSNNKSVGWLHANGNEIETINLDGMSKLSELNLSDNMISEIDLSDCSSLYTFACENNKLKTIDLNGLRNLKIVYLYGNEFRFSTLPEPTASWMQYTYGNQSPVEVELTSDGKIDLSSEKDVSGTATSYKWFTVSGTELIENEDVVVEDGITTFLKGFGEDIYCVMTNSVFPNLELRTIDLEVLSSEIETVDASDFKVIVNQDKIIVNSAEAVVEVYGINGMLIEKACIVDGSATVAGLEKGIYIVKTAGAVTKVVI